MFGPDVVIPALKVAVSAVTVLLIASLVALARGNRRLHGRINFVFFILTMVAVVGLEVVIRLLNPDFLRDFSPEDRRALSIHLGFSIPSAVLLPVMLWSGKHSRRVHLPLAWLFGVLWLGTVVTGLFFLPHSFPATP